MRVGNIGWNFLYAADLMAGLIPGVSSISGITDFAIKCILKKKTVDNAQLNRYFTHIKKTHYGDHLITAVPIIGNFINGMTLTLKIFKIDPNYKKPVPQKDAFKEMVKMANLRQPDAMFKLANAYLEGKGVEKNREKGDLFA